MATRAFAVVVAVRVALWLLPSRWSLRIAQRVDARLPRERSGRPAPVLIVWAVDAVASRIPKASCLTRAMSAQLLLYHFGYRPRLCLGVEHGNNNQFRAHAWLELDGRVIIGARPNVAFTRFPSLSRRETSMSFPAHR